MSDGDDGDERLRVEQHEYMSGMTEIRIVKETFEPTGFGGGHWEYNDAMSVKNESSLETLGESLNEWFGDDERELFIHRFVCHDCDVVTRADRKVGCFKCGEEMEYDQRIGEINP